MNLVSGELCHRQPLQLLHTGRHSNPQDGPCSIQKSFAISTDCFSRCDWFENPRPAGSSRLLGDTRMLAAARLEARKNFENNRGLATGSEEYTRQVAHADEVAKFLRENVVQGQATDTEGNYSMFESKCGSRYFTIANTIKQSSISTSIPSGETMRISRKERGIRYQEPSVVLLESCPPKMNCDTLSSPTTPSCALKMYKLSYPLNWHTLAHRLHPEAEQWQIDCQGQLQELPQWLACV